VYKSKLVTTRKKHKCVECGNRIAIAEKAEKVDALYDGGFQTFYTCLQCQEIINFIRQDHDDDLLKELKDNLCCHGELYELLDECVFDSQEEEEGYACHYRPNVSWLNPFVNGKLSLSLEARL
jgi:DNA-directed RNA polymerase subunit RPC12/RpoP